MLRFTTIRRRWGKKPWGWEPTLSNTFSRTKNFCLNRRQTPAFPSKLLKYAISFFILHKRPPLRGIAWVRVLFRECKWNSTSAIRHTTHLLNHKEKFRWWRCCVSSLWFFLLYWCCPDSHKQVLKIWSPVWKLHQPYPVSQILTNCLIHPAKWFEFRRVAHFASLRRFGWVSKWRLPIHHLLWIPVSGLHRYVASSQNNYSCCFLQKGLRVFFSHGSKNFQTTSPKISKLSAAVIFTS